MGRCWAPPLVYPTLFDNTRPILCDVQRPAPCFFGGCFVPPRLPCRMRAFSTVLRARHSYIAVYRTRPRHDMQRVCWKRDATITIKPFYPLCATGSLSRSCVFKKYIVCSRFITLKSTRPLAPQTSRGRSLWYVDTSHPRAHVLVVCLPPYNGRENCDTTRGVG